MVLPEVTSWAMELVPRLGTVARLYLPGAPLDGRRRELLSAVVAGARGVPAVADLHMAWLDVLGPADLDDLDDEIFAWAADAAQDCSVISDGPGLPVEESVGRALAAALVHGVVVALTVTHARRLGARMAGREPRRVAAMAGDLVGCGVGAPATVPVLVAAGLVREFGRLVPAPPSIVVDPEPNLLSHLLADAVPAWLGGVGGRLLAATLPVEVPVAWRSGNSGATVRVGRGRVQVENGVADDAWALFDGDVDSLVRAGSRTLAREVRASRLGR